MRYTVKFCGMMARFCTLGANLIYCLDGTKLITRENHNLKDIPLCALVAYKAGTEKMTKEDVKKRCPIHYTYEEIEEFVDYFDLFVTHMITHR
jgi:hypothetical protein